MGGGSQGPRSWAPSQGQLPGSGHDHGGGQQMQPLAQQSQQQSPWWQGAQLPQAPQGGWTPSSLDSWVDTNYPNVPDWFGGFDNVWSQPPSSPGPVAPQRPAPQGPVAQPLSRYSYNTSASGMG